MNAVHVFFSLNMTSKQKPKREKDWNSNVKQMRKKASHENIKTITSFSALSIVIFLFYHFTFLFAVALIRITISFVTTTFRIHIFKNNFACSRTKTSWCANEKPKKLNEKEKVCPTNGWQKCDHEFFSHIFICANHFAIHFSHNPWLLIE